MIRELRERCSVVPDGGYSLGFFAIFNETSESAVACRRRVKEYWRGRIFYNDEFIHLLTSFIAIQSGK